MTAFDKTVLWMDRRIADFILSTRLDTAINHIFPSFLLRHTSIVLFGGQNDYFFGKYPTSMCTAKCQRRRYYQSYEYLSNQANV